MASKGCRYPKVCPYTVTENSDGTETETYGVGKAFGKAANSDMTINAAPVNYYANDGIAESVSEFTDGTIKHEADTLVDSVEAEALGHIIDENGVMISGSDDSPPYEIYSVIVPQRINGVNKYLAVVLTRVQWEPQSGSYKSKEKSTTLSGTTINGTIMKNKDNTYMKKKMFDTEAQALAWQATECHMPSSHDTLTCTPVPADAATNIAITANITLTFNNPIDHGNATLQNATTHAIIASTKTFNGGKTVLTIDPSASLTASTAYVITVTGMTDAYGQTLADTVYTFTTAA